MNTGQLPACTTLHKHPRDREITPGLFRKRCPTVMNRTGQRTSEREVEREVEREIMGENDRAGDESSAGALGWPGQDKHEDKIRTLSTGTAFLKSCTYSNGTFRPCNLTATRKSFTKRGQCLASESKKPNRYVIVLKTGEDPKLTGLYQSSHSLFALGREHTFSDGMDVTGRLV